MGHGAKKRIENLGGCKDVFDILNAKNQGPRCYPPFPISTGKGGDRAERIVFGTLRKDLDEGWILFHSFAVLNKPSPDHPAKPWQSDIDFVMLHRQKGIVIVEVKDIPLEAKWQKIYAYYNTQPTDVLGKIGGALRFLKGHLQSLGCRITDRQFGSVILVAMQNKNPLSRILDNKIPLELVPGIYLDHLPVIMHRGELGIPFSDAVWRQLTQIFSEQAEKIYKMGALTALVASDALDRGFQTLQTQPEYQETYELLNSEENIIIKGFAGSGKTQLMLQAVGRMCEDPNKNALVLCYNDLLADWLKTQLESFKNVVVFPFLRLCQKLAEQIDPAYGEIPEDGKREYFKQTLPWIIKQGLSEGHITIPRFTGIFIDESQDLDLSWVPTIEALTQPSTRWLCNFDKSQLWQGDQPIPSAYLTEDHPFLKNFRTISLSNNLRNPNNIRNAALEHLKYVDKQEFPL